MGADDRPSTSLPPDAPVERPANGERDDRMKEAVEAARRQAEERATAEILALEQDLERERAAKSLEEVQRRLEEAEARAAGSINLTDTRTREDSADWLGEQRGDVRRELEAEMERRMLAREKELVAERDEAAATLKDALERLERVESAGADEETRAEAERRLKAQIEAMESETEARIQKA